MTSTRTVRTVAAAAVLVSAYVHLYEWLNGFRHDNVMGPLFAINVIAGVAIAVLLFTWRHWLVPFFAFGFGASTLGGFAIATTSAGLFGTHEKWEGTYVWLAAVAEAVAIIAGLVALSREYRGAPARQQSRSSSLAR